MGLIKVIFLSTEPEISDSCCKCVINLLYKSRLIHTLYSMLKQHKKNSTHWDAVDILDICFPRDSVLPSLLFWYNAFSVYHCSFNIPFALTENYTSFSLFFPQFIYLRHLTIFCVQSPSLLLKLENIMEKPLKSRGIQQ